VDVHYNFRYTTSMLEIVVIILIAILIVVIVGAIFFMVRQSKSVQTSNDQQQHSQFTHLQQQITASSQNQDQKLAQINQQLTTAIQNLLSNIGQNFTQQQALSGQTQKAMHSRLDITTKTLSDLKGQLGQLSQATQHIIQVGSEVKNLQDILKSPKLRGGFGEWTLENLLADIIPTAHYETQYRFQDGGIVDAIIHLANSKVCIDAKFPLENFTKQLATTDPTMQKKHRREFIKDVKKHIDSIAEKYIIPQEGTLDFALMYIPAENVYYEATILNEEDGTDINSYARKKKVIPVSPNTLYAYLTVVATGLKGLKIEENANLILKQLSQLTGDINQLDESFTVVGKHLTNAKTKYDETKQQLEKFSQRIQSCSQQQDE